MADLLELAQAALPTDESDWGSDRQIDAENAFGDAVERILGTGSAAFRDWEQYALKATTEEMVAEALRLCRR